MSKYFENKKLLPRVTNELVELFKVKYEEYYGVKCRAKSSRIDYELRLSFEIFDLDIYKEEDRDWYRDNVLKDIFKKYDDLGYSSGEKFCVGHLHVEWLMIKLLREVSKGRYGNMPKFVEGDTVTFRDEVWLEREGLLEEFTVTKVLCSKEQNKYELEGYSKSNNLVSVTEVKEEDLKFFYK